MDRWQTGVLGAVAGFTILLGLPVGRVRTFAPVARQLFNALTIGVLLFLLWDVLAHAWEPIDAGLSAGREGSAGWAPVAGHGLLFVAGLAVGLLGLAGYERWLARRAPAPAAAADGPRAGPGAMAATEATISAASEADTARRLALLIAVGIGLHNTGEGLAIGASAGRGELSLATVLVVGFAVHNATEGFGIVAPLAAAGVRAGWPALLGLGLIGGGPTLLGTLIGREFSSDALSIAFLTLAAGSIVYVVLQLTGLAWRQPARSWLYVGVLLGLVLGFATDLVVSLGGA